jgi:hypothetical protein
MFALANALTSAKIKICKTLQKLPMCDLNVMYLINEMIELNYKQVVYADRPYQWFDGDKFSYSIKKSNGAKLEIWLDKIKVKEIWLRKNFYIYDIEIKQSLNYVMCRAQNSYILISDDAIVCEFYVNNYEYTEFDFTNGVLTKKINYGAQIKTQQYTLPHQDTAKIYIFSPNIYIVHQDHKNYIYLEERMNAHQINIPAFSYNRNYDTIPNVVTYYHMIALVHSEEIIIINRANMKVQRLIASNLRLDIFVDAYFTQYGCLIIRPAVGFSHKEIY